MSYFDSIVSYVMGKLGSSFIKNWAEENKKNVRKENLYEDVIADKAKGIVLTWIETKPVIGDLLKSLGPRREKLYKILAQPGGNKATDLPLDDPLSELVSGFAVHKLYSQMLHPPQTYLGNKFQFRSADGSVNNAHFPQLGKAGTPYAKSVPSVNIIQGSQPDPGDLFDLLLGRDETSEEDMRESNLGISSMLLYHATIIIHDVFRTNVGDKNISDTSSYLDLSPLYGKDAKSQETVRAFHRGLLKPDTFAEERLLNQPVGVCIYLIMYNRFHNYVAEQLLEINENGKFFKPPDKKEDGWRPNANWQPPKKNWKLADSWKPPHWPQAGSGIEWPQYRDQLAKAAETNEEAMLEMYSLWKTAAEQKLDEDLFQTARLITCGMFINISIHDYLRVLTRVHLKNTPWTLDPRKEIPLAMIDPRGVQRGQGNQVSAEFNVLYRFHSPLSRRDVRWTSKFLTDLLKDFVKPVKERTPNDGPCLTEEELASYNIPIPVMGAALKKMYAMLPTFDDKITAKAFPVGLDPELGGPSVKYKFKRDPKTHKFDDKQLVEEMVRVMEDPTCEFGAKNTARMFRSIEILGILQARKWELASLNEFRKFFGLSVHKTFEAMNANPEIAEKLKNIYRHPDQVELYPGLVCEGQGRCLDPGTNGPGGEGTALWRAVFSDAVTLVRSDRFYTTDWNVGSLTGWGMREVTSIPEVMKGSVMHRLFQRAFPGFFPYNSLHLWQPFHIPAMNFVLANSQGVSADLESLPEMGISNEVLQNIAALMKAQDGDSFYKSNIESGSGSWIHTLESLEKDHKVGYTALEITQIKEANEIAKDEAGRGFLHLQMAFKPLKRAIRMPDSKFNTQKATGVYVTSYDTIVQEILAKPSIFKNPGYLDSQSIPQGPLQAILTGKADQKLGVKIRTAIPMIRQMVDQKREDLFMEYFSEQAKGYLKRESRKYQVMNVPGTKDPLKSTQVYQIDVVSDVAMPVVAQFVSDFLGFWDWTDPDEPKDSATDASITYQHLSNCQDYLTYNSDELSVFPRRIEFRKSILWLNKASIHGIKQVSDGKRGSKQPKDVSDNIWKVRDFGSSMARELLNLKLDKDKVTRDEAAAIRLSIALDAVHKSILMFTEVLNHLLHTRDDKNFPYLWKEVKNLAISDANKKLSGYVLEAQRLVGRVPLVRQVADDVTELPKIKTSDGLDEVEIQKGTVLLVDTHEAQQNMTYFKDPKTFNPNRKPEEYLIYGRNPDSPFTAKDLTIIAITALIKEMAKLDTLRRAHNTEGRINKAKTPDGVERYLTQEFDRLVPFPTTWQLRHNGEGKGIYVGDNNSDVSDGMENIYQDGQLSAGGGSLHP
ncbi:hypothetical protein MMC11_005861 [Xylographa trunciseda]|nr:hypothetical protein [Xylographa trunciseda]